MKLTSKIKKALNACVRRTDWYKNQEFKGCEKFWRHQVYDLDVVNLGSSSALYGFDYSNSGLKAANWAMSPQTLVADYEILRNYFSFLKPGATIILPICPFSSLGGGDKYMPDYYYTILHRESIPHFSCKRYTEICDRRDNPIKHFPLYSIFGELRLKLKKRNPQLKPSQFEEDAEKWARIWKSEFSINDFSDTLSIINRLRMEDSSQVLSKIVNFCKARALKPIVVIPPMHPTLFSKLEDNFDKYIYGFIRLSISDDVKVLDYTKNKDLTIQEYFMNALLLNKIGAEAFTQLVLQDLDLQS